MLRLLLIDDNPQDRILASRELQREFASLHVTQVIKESEFAQALELGQFDLAISDYQLRWSDGLKVLRAIKARYPDRPVIMFTNSSTQEMAVEAMKAGLDDYIVKSPKHYVRLSAAVRSALERVAIQRKAANTEIRLQTLLNQLNVGVYRLKLDGSLLEANPAFLRLLGLNSLAVIQAGQSLEPYFQPGDYAQLLTHLKQSELLRDREAPPQEAREVQLRRADGSLLWVRLSKTFSSVDGETIVDGLVEDISTAKQAEQEREKLLALEQAARAASEAALSAAEAANRVKDEFLAVLSHELRSPLNSILGWAKILRSRKPNETTTARALETIERNARLQAQLIEDLLDISRILKGKLSLNVCKVNLVSTIEAAIDTMRLAAEAKSIQIQTLIDSNLGVILGDPARLQQIVWNLLSNAIKFTPQGGQVEVRLETVGSQAQIQVKDTGIGISAGFLPEVFEYFRQSDASITRTHGGLGLGLAIVRHLVELHGGTVQVESPGEGQGATFTVLLPLMNVQPNINDTTEQFDPLLELNGLQVLVVDDEADSRELLLFLLEQYGAIVRAVASASDAFDMLEHFTPDIIVSDIGMPEKDGYTLIRRVRSLALERGGSIPAIALTAYAREEDRNQSLAAGFQRHIAKPVEPAQLLTAFMELNKGVETA